MRKERVRAPGVHDLQKFVCRNNTACKRAEWYMICMRCLLPIGATEHGLHIVKAKQHISDLKRKRLPTFSVHEDYSMGLAKKLF